MVVLAAAAVLARRALFADGSHLLVRILEETGPALVDPARHSAECLTQAPAVLAVRMGLRDIPTLVTLFGIGHVVFPVALWGAALCLLRGDRLLWPFTLLFSLVHLNAGGMPAGEYNVAYGGTALCLAILLRERWLSPAARGALVASALVLVRSYEALIHLGPLLATLAAVRAWRSRTRPLDAATLTTAALLFTAGAVAAARALSTPRDPVNLQHALDLAVLARNGQLRTSVLLAAWYLLVPMELFRRPWPRPALWLGPILVALMALPWTWSSPQDHYGSRTVVGLLLLGFGAAVGWTRLSERERQCPRRGRTFVLVPLATLAVLGVADLRLSLGFGAFYGHFEREVNSRTGLVRLEETQLVERGGRTHGWPWTYPSMSLLLRRTADGAIILNPRGYAGWQPFDPRVAVPDLSAYYRS